jgi:hypothetical protein
MNRQPVHTVYGGAHLFRFDTARKLGDVALRLLDEHANDAMRFADVLDIPLALGESIHARVRAKLGREPVEDFRIDFEDGYGQRADSEEDAHAESAAAEVAKGFKQDTLPPYIGIRIKPLGGELKNRSLRTLDIFIDSLFRQTGPELAERFFITLPKLLTAAEPALLAESLSVLEQRSKLPARSLRFEIMVETPQTIFTKTGAAAMPLMVDAGDGRISAAHFGTYDFTASCNITAAHQHMNHPVCDFARAMMQVCLSDRVWLSDGSTAVLPVGSRDDVYAAW